MNRLAKEYSEKAHHSLSKNEPDNRGDLNIGHEQAVSKGVQGFLGNSK